MSEGIVILAHSTEQTDYKLNDAVRNFSKTVRKHQTNHVEICLVTHQAKWLEDCAEYVDHIVEFPFGDAGYEDGNTLKNLYQLWHASPFERNLVCAVDTMIMQDPNEILRALQGQSLIFASKRKTFNNKEVRNVGIIDVYEKLNLPRLLTDFWYFEKKTTQPWFDLLGMYSANYIDVSRELGSFAPQKFDIDIIVALTTDIANMTNDVKDLGILEYTDLAVHDNWPTHLNYWIKEELIKVENFALGGLLHLGRYAPFREIHNEY